MRKLPLILLLLCAATLFAAKPKGRADLEKALKKSPGNMELRCELIGMLLAAGDTTEAETHIRYAQKMQPAECISLHAAHIAFARNRYTDAARLYADATLLGAFPTDDPNVYAADSLSRGSIAIRLRAANAKDKSKTAALIGLAEMALHRADTAAAVSLLEEAVVRGDTALISRIKTLKSVLPTDSTEKTVVMRIPFERNYGKIEMQVVVNGLKVKAQIDTTATQSTISGVESSFMLKNEYTTHADIIDNTVMLVRTLELPDGTVLKDVRLHNKNAQEAPVILSLSVLEPLGKARINEKEAVIEILN